jgi:hypothetical protein
LTLVRRLLGISLSRGAAPSPLVLENRRWLTRTSSRQSFRIISKKQSGQSLGSAPSTTRTRRRFSAGEQKTAKVTQLLEESRRDNPLIRDRLDREAETMAQPADPKSVLDAIKETRRVDAG